MIELRPFAQIGHANHGWLDANHHFSFADYYEPTRMHWGNLRVWNDDTIAAKSGFPPHPHRDMEIITYVRSGAITHRDSLGNQGRTAAGDVQVMSAGTGITHAEFNLEDETTTLFQIWIQPTRTGEKPGWGARQFPKGDRSGQLVVLASGYDEDVDALKIRTEARLVGGTIRAGETIDYQLGTDRKGYLVPATGRIEVNGVAANARDGVAIADVETITITAHEDAEIVLVDTL
ncbi:MAG: pirin family protein [Sphingomonadales bacterium]|nr:pirin family protein [Sphingomonadales bacterium]MDE2171884.1 pirin family protein [Sphingomonadales bacterium]